MQLNMTGETINIRDTFTTTERAIFDALVEAGEKGLTRTELYTHTLKKDSPSYISNVVDVHIKNLRVKLKGTKYTLSTIRSVGYILVDNNTV